MSITGSGQSLAQKRAEFAWNSAKDGVAGERGKNYVTLVKGASSFIMGNGLMQALAFYHSRDKIKEAEAQSLLRHILEWLDRSRVFEREKVDQFDSAMKALFKTDSQHYMRATRETLLMLRWLRQFADALQVDNDRAQEARR